MERPGQPLCGRAERLHPLPLDRHIQVWDAGHHTYLGKNSACMCYAVPEVQKCCHSLHMHCATEPCSSVGNIAHKQQIRAASYKVSFIL